MGIYTSFLSQPRKSRIFFRLVSLSVFLCVCTFVNWTVIKLRIHMFLFLRTNNILSVSIRVCRNSCFCIVWCGEICRPLHADHNNPGGLMCHPWLVYSCLPHPYITLTRWHFHKKFNSTEIWWANNIGRRKGKGFTFPFLVLDFHTSELVYKVTLYWDTLEHVSFPQQQLQIKVLKIFSNQWFFFIHLLQRWYSNNINMVLGRHTLKWKIISQKHGMHKDKHTL